jgi:hypothetical protein
MATGREDNFYNKKKMKLDILDSNFEEARLSETGEVPSPERVVIGIMGCIKKGKPALKK